MQWIITKDLINTAPGEKSKVNFRRVSKEFKEAYRTVIADEHRTETEARQAQMLEEFKDSMNFQFRLYDDDGELYYEGLCKDLDDVDGDQAFEPLDWAMNDVGCTRMDYRKKGAVKWQTL